jgi:hypothetical protein
MSDVTTNPPPPLPRAGSPRPKLIALAFAVAAVLTGVAFLYIAIPESQSAEEPPAVRVTILNPILLKATAKVMGYREKCGPLPSHVADIVNKVLKSANKLETHLIDEDRLDWLAVYDLLEPSNQLGLCSDIKKTMATM